MNLAGIKKRLCTLFYLKIEDGLFECQLQNTAVFQDPKFRRLTAVDRELLATNFGLDKATEFVTRLNEATGFLYEQTPGVIAGYGWATGNTRAREGEKPFFYRIIPQDGDLYVFDFFVKPEHRGQGVASAMMKGVLDYGRSKGLTHCFTLHDLNNSAMIKASESAGLRKSGVLTYRRIGPWVKRDTSALRHRT